MFNAVNGLGGGGRVDPGPADRALAVLYAAFSIVAFFAGSIANKLGIKLTFSFGGFSYVLYVASLLCYNHTAKCRLHDFCWGAPGCPLEISKGKYIAWFWMIFNLGSVLGSLISLAQNINDVNTGIVNDGTYVVFIVLTFFGVLLALCLCDADKVVRENGTKVILMKNPTWKSEFMGLWEVLRSDTYIILLFPMFFASNWFYTYQFNGVNGAHFNVRTRALNTTLYYIAEIIGAFTFGYALDLKYFRRTVRAKTSIISLFVLTMAIWGGGYAWQVQQNPRYLAQEQDYHTVDWADDGYIGSMSLYMFYGFYDAAWQTCVYWYIGALTNSGRKTVNLAGFYKGVQSAGAAISWAIDSASTDYTAEFASCWGLLAGSLLIAAPVIYRKVKDHVTAEEDLKFSDEMLEDVVPARHIKNWT